VPPGKCVAEFAEQGAMVFDCDIQSSGMLGILYVVEPAFIAITSAQE